MAYEAHVEGAPTEEVVRRLIEEARAPGPTWSRSRRPTRTARPGSAPGSRRRPACCRRRSTRSSEHLGAREEPSFGSIHVQTDDVDAVVRAVRQFVPRLPGGSQGSVVLPPSDGWTSAYDELTDREPEMLRRLAREISDRMGAFVLTDGPRGGTGRPLRRARARPRRGRVPLRSPSTTGRCRRRGDRARRQPAADGPPHRGRRRRRPRDRAHRGVARRAASGPELLAELARLFGVPQAANGYPEAAEREDAIVIPRA